MSGPTTDAGRALLEVPKAIGDVMGEAGMGVMARSIAAIEAEARQQERERITFEVKALDHTSVLGGRGHGTIHEPTREAVLVAIADTGEGEKPKEADRE